ncbi:hypothetical protein AB0B10_06565 [Micromonospora arborensis]|uniref:hypothetical protein n=1 Tax=Micromonospora arborensis TaxID=2116518 RepID=UPI0033C833F3
MEGQWEAGSFWATVAGVAVTLVVGLLAAAIALRTVPRRRLLYRMSDPVAMLSMPEDLRPDLEVRRNGQTVQAPHIVDLLILGSGRQDVTSGEYDRGIPLKFDFGVPIVEHLRTRSRPAEATPPPLEVDGQVLSIGPGLIGARQIMQYTLLVDGVPELVCQSSLANVEIVRNDGDWSFTTTGFGHWWNLRSIGFRRASTALLGAVMAGVVTLAGIAINNALETARQPRILTGSTTASPLGVTRYLSGAPITEVPPPDKVCGVGNPGAKASAGLVAADSLGVEVVVAAGSEPVVVTDIEFESVELSDPTEGVVLDCGGGMGGGEVKDMRLAVTIDRSGQITSDDPQFWSQNMVQVDANQTFSFNLVVVARNVNLRWRAKMQYWVGDTSKSLIVKPGDGAETFGVSSTGSSRPYGPSDGRWAPISQ